MPRSCGRIAWLVGPALVQVALASPSLPATIRLSAEPGTQWSEPDRAALAAAFASLPEPMRQFPGGPLEIVLCSNESALGLGDGSPARPEWSDGHRRFFVYSYRDSSEPRASYRLARLSLDQRRSLWRRRALVHAVMQRWDDALHLSGSQAWRDIDGWLRPFERRPSLTESAQQTYAGAFSRRRGQDSASLDWITFAEEAIAPVEALAAEALDVDDQVRCQEPTKSRVMFSALAAKGLWPAPSRERCPLFDRWARIDSLEGIEVLFVAAGGRTESLFGHLMLRPVWRAGDVQRGPSFEPIVQVVAMTGGKAAGPEYLWRGLTGGFSLAYVTVPFGDVRRQTSELEQRSTRRYRLNLTSAERLRAMQRIWELERRGYRGYYFFTENCATAVLEVVNGILEGNRRAELPPPWEPLLPEDALDRLAAVSTLDGRPLLEPVDGDLEATGQSAARAYVRRAQLLRSLESGSAMSLWARRLAQTLSSGDLARRTRAYAALRYMLNGPLSDSDRRASVEMLADSVRIERYALDRAEAAKLAVELQAIDSRALHPPTPEDVAAERQRLFQSERALQRHPLLLDRMAQYEDEVRSAPKRAFTAEEQRVIDRASQTRALFTALTDEEASAVDALEAFDGAAWLENDARAQVEAQHTQANGALERSGIGRTEAGGGFLSNGAGAWLPMFELRSAVVREEMGEHRVHSLRSALGLDLIDDRAQLTWSDGTGRLARNELTLIDVRTLGRDLPTERRGWLDGLGWEARAGWDYRANWALSSRAEARGGLLAVVAEDPTDSRFFALSLGGLAQVRWSSTQLEPVLGPRVGATVRLDAGSLGVLRADAAFAPVFILGTIRRWSNDGSLDAEWLKIWARLGAVSVAGGVRFSAEWEEQTMISSSVVLTLL